MADNESGDGRWLDFLQGTIFLAIVIGTLLRWANGG